MVSVCVVRMAFQFNEPVAYSLSGLEYRFISHLEVNTKGFFTLFLGPNLTSLLSWPYSLVSRPYPAHTRKRGLGPGRLGNKAKSHKSRFALCYCLCFSCRTHWCSSEQNCAGPCTAWGTWPVTAWDASPTFSNPQPPWYTCHTYRHLSSEAI